MKSFLSTTIVFMLVVASAAAQQQPAVGTEAYQQWKEQGRIRQTPPVPRQKSYPVLHDATKTEAPQAREVQLRTKGAAAGAQLQTQALVASGCAVEDPGVLLGFQTMPPDDDSSTGLISLQFTFNLFGKNYNQIYVNNNGNITFNAANADYTATGFPSPNDMIAPFWADVDTRGARNGRVYYKSEPTRFTVIWYRVGYYNTKTDKVNTFKLVITDGTDATIGAGNNVAFMYGDMQWTTGDASGGAGGFGGTPATVGVNSGVGTDACFYYQLGRFGKPGTEFIDAYTAAGVDYLDNKCFFFDASTIEDVTFDFIYTHLLCAVEFSPVIVNPQNCQILYYYWDFGDGNISEELNPLYSFGAPGTYSVSFNAFYSCGACNNDPVTITKNVVINAAEDALIDTLINVVTDTRQQILSAAVTTYSDAWPLRQTVAGLNEKHGFSNGTQGVWRNEGTHVYDVPRLQTSPPDLAHDGTFSMDYFNWDNADVGAIPNWIKATTITGYSPYSYDVETRDVIGVYSSALYDYGGHLPSANGTNMRQNEMAFTGFEYLDGKSSGNWIFGNQPLPQSYIYSTDLSYNNIAIVKASPQALENVDKVDVVARSVWIFGWWRTQTIIDDQIVCVRSHPQNPEWSLVVLRTAPMVGIWTGEITVKNTIQPIISPVVDQTIAHTGRTSLKITAATTFKQELLQLDSGKNYVVNAWVSVNNPNVLTPKLADGLGFQLTMKNKQNTSLGTFSFTPAGTVIEGWQQVKGTFTCPDKNLYLEIQFKPGSTGTAWYDDLRLHPEKGNMRSYVYDLNDYRLRAILDEENFASLFFYDQEGNLHLTQKETEDGIKTLTENVNYHIENHN